MGEGDCWERRDKQMDRRWDDSESDAQVQTRENNTVSPCPTL